jgi:hypothetical protein
VWCEQLYSLSLNLGSELTRGSQHQRTDGTTDRLQQQQQQQQMKGRGESKATSTPTGVCKKSMPALIPRSQWFY